MTPAWTNPATPKAARLASAISDALPHIETARLILRPCKGSDWAHLEPIWTTECAVYIGGPMTPEDAWLDFTQCVAAWMLQGSGPLTITRKGDDTPLGLVLLCAEFGDPSPELGWLLREEAEGFGYATEAAIALRNWAFADLELDSFASFVDQSNAASIRVAEKLGAKQTGVHPLADDCLVFTHTNKGASA